MKKIIVTQYREEPSGSTIGAHTYHYGVDFNGNYSYSFVTTTEGIDEMISALKVGGHEVQFVQKWKS